MNSSMIADAEGAEFRMRGLAFRRRPGCPHQARTYGEEPTPAGITSLNDLETLSKSMRDLIQRKE